MLNKEGKTVTSKEEIKTVFENYYIQNYSKLIMKEMM